MLLAELGYPASAEAMPERLERLLAGRAAAFMAESGGQTVGLGTAQMLNAMHEDAPMVMLTTLVVAAGAQRLGVGRLLVERVEQWGRSHGAARSVVATGLARSGAHAFYETIGYEHKSRYYAKRL